MNDLESPPRATGLEREQKSPRPSVLNASSLFKPLPPSPPGPMAVVQEPKAMGSGEELGNLVRKTRSNGVTTLEIRQPRLPVPELLATSPLSPRPIPSRAHTAPGSPSSHELLSNKLAALHIQPPRARSPYSRSHLRSRSSTSSPLLQPTVAPRSHSASYGEFAAQVGRPVSPLARPRSPFSLTPRRVSPLRRPLEESRSFSGLDIDQTIAENSELHLKPRPALSVDTYGEPFTSAPHTPSSPPLSAGSGGGSGHGTFPRMRRRPSSPLHVALASPGFRLHTSSSSPALRSPASPAPIDPAKFNEAYPQAGASPHLGASALSIASGSSMPSTPSSFRSRSPSISSLETIPDSPDAEEEAVAAAETDREKDAIARVRAASERSEGPRRGRSLGRTTDYFGNITSEKRKRWSVCGAERRGDLEMETIWED